MLKLKRTCDACPEQYDVFQGEELVGYMRLRHGYFRAESRGKVVYECVPLGDGCFECDERDGYLEEACKAILKDLVEGRDGGGLYEIV